MAKDEKFRFEQAINVISTRIKMLLLQLDEKNISHIQEIRLRTDKPVVIVTDAGSCFINDKAKLTKLYSSQCIVASQQEINDTVNRVCNYSIHSNLENINNGFITVKGGHRVGLCGTAVYTSKSDYKVKDINCINIRISRQIIGASEKITELLFKNGLPSIIICGSPSSGKTTVLRDLSYRLSSGFTGRYIKTCVIDERGEFSASYNGVLQNNLGLNTDVLINYKKKISIELALRTLSPEYIILDELTNEEDCSAIEYGLNCGVSFALSVHCSSEKELKNKPVINKLIGTGAFEYIVFLSQKPLPSTVKNIIKITYRENETVWTDINNDLLGYDRHLFTLRA